MLDCCQYPTIEEVEAMEPKEFLDAMLLMASLLGPLGAVVFVVWKFFPDQYARAHRSATIYLTLCENVKLFGVTALVYGCVFLGAWTLDFHSVGIGSAVGGFLVTLVCVTLVLNAVLERYTVLFMVFWTTVNGGVV
jgi:hypothetical protein